MKLTYALTLLLLVIANLLTPFRCFSEEGRVLDFRYPPQQSRPKGGSIMRGPGVPGSSSSVATYELPLKIDVMRATVTETGNAPSMDITIMLTNISTTTYALPTSRDVATISKSQNNDRRDFAFLVKGVDLRQHQEFERFIALSAMSSSLPGSSISLAPGESVKVVLKFDGPKEGEKLDPSKIANLRIGIREQRYREGTFFIEAASLKKWSEKSDAKFSPGGDRRPQP